MNRSFLGATPKDSDSVSLGKGPGQTAGPRCGVQMQRLMKGTELLILNRMPLLGGVEEKKKNPFLSNFLDSLARALEIKLTD